MSSCALLRVLAPLLVSGALILPIIPQTGGFPLELSGDDLGRTRDLLQTSTLGSTASVFVFPKHPKFKLKHIERVRRPPTAPGSQKPPKTLYTLPVDTSGVETWAELGLTLWKLEPVTSKTEGTRMLVQVDRQKVEMVPRRVEATTIFQAGDHIRLSIESPRDGYLYVIDREMRSGNKLGEPMQIFPTMTARHGDNRVNAGQVVDLPEQSDAAPTFDFTMTNPDWEGEMLTIIVSHVPIPQMPTLPKAAPVEPDLIAAFENSYSRDIAEYEQDGTAGAPYTSAEQMAGAGTRQLTQNDPYPQTVYRVKTSLKHPMILTLPLKISN